VKPSGLSRSCIAFSGGVALYAGADEEADLSKPFDVEIALSGQYKARDFELGAKQFGEMIANHKRSGVDPALDREHESWFSMAAQPALGWVKALRVENASGDARRRALVATVELNDVGQHAVKNGHFRYVSMGMEKAGKDRQTGDSIGAVLDHLALVKNPFIQGMRPLSLALSAKLGRLVEEEPMDLLAQKLREALGLSADATEEQIIAAHAAAAGKLAAEKTDRESLSKALDEQKRINERLEGGLKALAADRETRDAAEWKEKLAAAVAAFTIAPAESTEQEKLTGAERALAARLLALRPAGNLKPAATALTAAGAGAGGGGKTADPLALNGAQEKALREYLSEHPGMDEGRALVACAVEQPQLFTFPDVPTEVR
jgi:hypothetical protein